MTIFFVGLGCALAGFIFGMFFRRVGNLNYIYDLENEVEFQKNRRNHEDRI